MEHIRNEILKTLDKAALNHQVRIPIAIESGSRGWGFPSTDSDYDCRFIYVHDSNWYLSIQQRPDTIYYQPDAVYDINGWDIKKVIQHIVKSNAAIHEWLSSEVRYRMNEAVWLLLWELSQDFYNPLAVSHHYLSCAASKFSELACEDAAKIKKYFYILRPLANLQYIRDYGTIPPLDYYQTLDKLSVPPDVSAQIRLLQQQKPETSEGDLIAENKILKDYFRREISYYEEFLKSQSVIRYKDYDKADHVFRKIIRMVWDDEGQ